MKVARSNRKPPRRRPTRPTPKPRLVKPHTQTAVSPERIVLVRMKGTPDRGGGPDGEAWRIDVDGKRAGVTFINVIDEPPFGMHASIQIYLNRIHQGRKIGRVAYRLASQMSSHDIIFAHMRRSNIASRRAAEEAGFVDVTPRGHVQLIMRRVRSSNDASPLSPS